MSLKAVWWMVVGGAAAAAVVLLNYWGSFQPLSTLAYAGIVMAVAGLANVAVPFRFLGIRRRAVGVLVLAGGVGLAAAALLWPAATVRVAQHWTLLDDVLPEYQFWERHTVRVHAGPEQVMRAVQETTVGELKSYTTLMRIRGVALRRRFEGGEDLGNVRVLDALSGGFTRLGTTEREIVMGGIGKVRPPRPEVRNAAEFVAYGQEGVKIAFNFYVEDEGAGWSRVVTETRALAMDDYSRRIMGRYWRLIVPGSGLLRREMLASIKRRAESESASNR